MRIELYHASKYGNGAKVAEEFRKLMGDKGHQVSVHHIKDSRPNELPQADLYVFGAPARVGKPIGSMRRFLKKMTLPKGTKYALIATHGAPRPNKKTGEMPPNEELEKWESTIRILGGILGPKGMVKVADMKVYVVDLKGPLEEGWQDKVEAFTEQIIQNTG
jgi:flavodoxin